MAVTAELSLKLFLLDPSGTRLVLNAAPPPIVLTDFADEVVTLPAAAYFVNIPFPVGLPAPKFAWVSAISAADLKAAQAYDGQAAIAVPQGLAQFFFSPGGIWLSSLLGGTAHVVIAG